MRIAGVKPIRKKRADGSIRLFYYHRATGRRLPDDPSSAEFKRAVEANNREAGIAVTPGPETLQILIREYEASPDWKKLAESTKAVERYFMAAIEDEFGDMPLTEIERKGSRSMFLEWHADLAEEHPRAADMKLGRLQTILKFGCDREKIDRNPLATFKRAHHVDRSEVIWLPEHFAALNGSKASVSMKFAAFLALHTGQRRGDLLALRWRQWDGSGITLVQSKSKKLGSSGRRVYIPATKALKDTLGRQRAAKIAEYGGGDIGELPILTSARGASYRPNAFRLAWEHAFAASGIAPIEIDGKAFKLHFHDIRGTAVTMLAEAGATVPEIATITGHSLSTVNRILERYLNRTKALAESAIAKLEWRMAKLPHMTAGDAGFQLVSEKLPKCPATGNPEPRDRQKRALHFQQLAGTTTPARTGDLLIHNQAL